MKAIHGENSGPYELGKKKRGGQKKSLKGEIPFGAVLVDMYEATQKKKYKTKKQLAEEFINKVNFNAERASAITRLVSAYTKYLPYLKSAENREWIRHRARIDDVQDGRGDTEIMNEKIVKEALQDVGWVFEWNPEDEEVLD